MGNALRRSNLNSLEENGIIRSTVFPNAVRDVRVRRGFETLRSFGSKVDVTYTRLAKIERGEIFPTADELKSIARAMGVPVGSLLIDQNDPEFDREEWARNHIEASLSHRGGGIEAMKLGAAMRVKRLAMGLSTTDMKQFGLPAATVSRIENADRPIERWDAGIQKGIAKVLGVRGGSGVTRVVSEMFEAGDLDDMLQDLFSHDAIQERNNKKLKSLLADLPGKKVAKLLNDLDDSGSETDSIQVLSSKSSANGIFEIALTDRFVAMPDGASRKAFALEVVDPVLGPGLPRGSVVICDPEQSASSGDVAVVLFDNGTKARLLSVADGSAGLIGFSMATDSTVLFSDLPKDAVIAKMISAVI